MNIITTPTVAVTGVTIQPALVQPALVQPALVQPALVQPTVVAVQPTVVQPTVVMSTMPMAAAIPDYMGYSIFTMLCCCLPLGIAATIYSCNTREANMAGQQELAKSSSRVAFILNNVALGIGLTVITLAIIVKFTAFARRL